MKRIAVALLLLLVLAASGYSQVSGDKLIVPGQRIGKWTLDMTVNDLLKMNGRRRALLPRPDKGPSPFADLASPTYEHLWGAPDCFYALTHGASSQKVIALGIGYPREMRASGACAGSSAYSTAKGVYRMDTLEAAYGKPTAITAAMWGASTVIYDRIGLAAYVLTDNTIDGFLVFRPGTARQIWRWSAASQLPDDRLIVPGQRIGKWTLDMTINSLRAMNGVEWGSFHRPLDPSHDLDDNPGNWTHYWDQFGGLVAYTLGRDSQRVIALGIEVETYKTAKGIAHGSSQKNLEPAYGKPTAVTVALRRADGCCRTPIFDEIGLGAWVQVPPAYPNNTQILGMIVFRSGTARNIWKY